MIKTHTIEVRTADFARTRKTLLANGFFILRSVFTPTGYLVTVRDA